MIQNSEQTMIFYAVDIVDSTPLKLLRKEEAWVNDVNRVYNNVLSNIHKHSKKNTHEENLKMWKFLGDEWVFVQNISNKTDIENGYLYFYENIHKEIADFFPVKSRIWVILPNEIKPIYHNYVQDSEISHMINTNSLDVDMQDLKPPIWEKKDWIGHAMDVGFRFGKNCNPYHIALSAEIAYLYLKSKDITDKNHFLKEEKEILKGIFYPYLSIYLHPKKNKYTKQNTKKLENYVKENIIHSFGKSRLVPLDEIISEKKTPIY